MQRQMPVAMRPAGPTVTVMVPEDHVERAMPLSPNKDGPPPTIIALTPTAAPSALGLASYASSTFIVSTYLANWYGNEKTPLYFWPFVLFYGGVGQFLAGMWCFLSRDTLASVIHTLWGSFWIALGISYNAMATGAVAAVGPYDTNPALAIWMCCLAWITLMGAIAALARDFVIATTLFLLGTGSVLGAIGWFGGYTTIIYVAAYFWIVSVFTALWRVGSYLLVEALPHRFTPGARDLLPRFSPHGLRQMFEQGYKIPLKEPGIIKGN